MIKIPQIWRSKESYISKDISKRENQRKNLKSQKKKGNNWGDLSKFEGAEGFKLFMVTHCRNLEGKVSLVLPWYEEVIQAIFNEDESEKVDLVIASVMKKAGKSFLGSCLAIYFSLFIDSPCEIVIASNSKDQSRDILLSYCKKIIKKNPALKRMFKIRGSDITCIPTDSVIRAVASLNAPAVAGKNIGLLLWDESALFDRDSQEELRNQLKLSPTKAHAVEVHLSTVGFLENEFSRLMKLCLENEEKKERGLEYDHSISCVVKQGKQRLAPWISEKFLERQKKHTKSQVYYRLWENTYIADEEKMFATSEQISGIIKPGGVRRRANIVIAIDASVSGDTTSLVAVEHREDDEIYRLIDHAITVPTKENRIDYQQAVIDRVFEWDEIYNILAIVADPYQLLAILQGFKKVGFNTIEFTQSTPNLTAMSHFLYTLIESQKLESYDDPDIIEHLGNCSTKLVGENRYRIIKAGVKRHIDLIICLAMACYVIAQGLPEESSGDIDIELGSWDHYGGSGKPERPEKVGFGISDIFGVYNR